MLDDRFAIKPVQNLWGQVKDGNISEEDVDSRGRLRVVTDDTCFDLDTLIERYTSKLKYIEENSVTYTSTYEPINDEAISLNELKVRLDALEKLVSNLIVSLRQANIPIVTDVYE